MSVISVWVVGECTTAHDEGAAHRFNWLLCLFAEGYGSDFYEIPLCYKLIVLVRRVLWMLLVMALANDVSS